MSTVKEKTKPKATVREATVHDLGAVCSLLEGLQRHEADFGDSGLVEDPGARRRAMVQYLSDLMFSHNARILLVDKKGYIAGLFIGEIETRPPMHKRRRVCNVWVGYAKRNPIFIKRILAEGLEWAKLKGCECMKVTVMTRNERVQKLMDRLGFKETYRNYERGVEP